MLGGDKVNREMKIKFSDKVNEFFKDPTKFKVRTTYSQADIEKEKLRVLKNMVRIQSIGRIVVAIVIAAILIAIGLIEIMKY